MTAATDDLLAILDLERLGDVRFRGLSPQVGWQRVFGGQVIGQALVAAARTVNGKAVHSLHAYFILPGDPAVPIDYEVDPIRNGGSFATRRVVARQHDRAIFSLAASFQRDEGGFDHQVPMPEVPPPEFLPDIAELFEGAFASASEAVRRYWRRERPIAFRLCDPDRPAHPRQNVWLKTIDRLPDDPDIHRAVLAYASDMTLLDTTLFAHRRSVFDPDIQAASLDHALWFHRPFRADEWLLYAEESPSASGGRGYAAGRLYTREGILVASVVQEGLIRPRRAARTLPKN